MAGENNPYERDPMNAFDFYFSDISERDGARQHALKDRPMETQKLMDVLSAETLLHYALWVELPKGHPTGELWLETNTDIRASIYLAYGGYFQQALTVLRSWFEISVLGVYFGGPLRTADRKVRTMETWCS